MKPQRRPLILNVDDDEAGRYAMNRRLRQAEFDVIEGASGAECLNLVKSACPDLILLDVRLPDISGFEVCRRIKADAATASIVVIHVSASFMDDVSKVKGLEGGADGYLTEPVEAPVLIATIRAFLRIREAERMVRDSARQWQSTFDAITDGVALVDREGVVIRWNRSLPSVIGRSGAEMEGARWDSLLPESASQSSFHRMLESGRRETMEHTVGESTFAVTCHPFYDETNELAGGVCIVSDITRRIRLEAKLRHAQKLESIGVLAGGVAHDFNNLLTGILGNASLALQLLRPSHEAAEPLADVIRSSERAADLTRQLLAYSGKGRFLVRPVDISELVREVMPLLQASVPRNAQILLTLRQNLPRVEADPAQLKQLLMNLVINAGEAIGKDAGTIRITTGAMELDREALGQFLTEAPARPGRHVLLEVRDTGCGMDKDIGQRIFDPFFTTKFLGRGLGLSAAMGIVRGHRGALRVISAPGEGSTFQIVLPVSMTDDHESSGTPGTEKSGQTVLVVDDEPLVRNMVKTTLERCNFRVLLAASGQEALEIFAGQPDTISLVLLDLAMPGLGGESVIPRLRSIRPDVEVIISTAYDEREAMARVGGHRVRAIIQKPYTSGALAEQIRGLV